MSLITMPSDVIQHIGTFCKPRDIGRLGSVCQSLNIEMNIFLQRAFLNLISVIKSLNCQVSSLSERQCALMVLWGGDRSDVKFRFPDESEPYEKAIQAMKPREITKGVQAYLQFKEKLIDSLEYISEVFDLEQLQVDGEFKSFHDVLGAAKIRRTIYVRLSPCIVFIYPLTGEDDQGSLIQRKKLYKQLCGDAAQFPYPAVSVLTSGTKKAQRCSILWDLKNTIPAEFCMGAKKGDSKTFKLQEHAQDGTLNNIELKIIFVNVFPLGFSSIEELFEYQANKMVLQHPESYNPPISHEEQTAMIKKVHDEHVRRVPSLKPAPSLMQKLFFWRGHS